MKEDENKRRVEEGLSVGLTKEVCSNSVYYIIIIFVLCVWYLLRV